MQTTSVANGARRRKKNGRLQPSERITANASGSRQSNFASLGPNRPIRPNTVNAVPRTASIAHGLTSRNQRVRRSAAGCRRVPPGQRTCRSAPRASVWRPMRAYIPRCTRVRIARPRDRRAAEAGERRGADRRTGDERIVSAPARTDGSTDEGDPLMALTLTRTPKQAPVPRSRGRRPRGRRHQGLRHGRGRGPRARRRQRRLRHRALHRDHGPVGLRQVDAHAHAGRSRLAHERVGLDRRRRARHAQRQEAHAAAPRPHRLHLPGVQPHPDADRGGEHHAADEAGRPQARPRSGSTTSSTPSASGTGSATVRRSSPAGSSSVSRSRVRSRAGRTSSSPTSRPATSTPAPAPRSSRSCVRPCASSARRS